MKKSLTGNRRNQETSIRANIMRNMLKHSLFIIRTRSKGQILEKNNFRRTINIINKIIITIKDINNIRKQLISLSKHTIPLTSNQPLHHNNNSNHHSSTNRIRIPKKMKYYE